MLVKSDKTQEKWPKKVTVPFSRDVFLVVAWGWPGESSISRSDFEGEESELSPQTEEEGSLSGCGDPWNSAMWSDEKGSLPATEMRDGAPESDSGEEVLKPLGRSDLVICMWL